MHKCCLFHECEIIFSYGVCVVISSLSMLTRISINMDQDMSKNNHAFEGIVLLSRYAHFQKKNNYLGKETPK